MAETRNRISNLEELAETKGVFKRMEENLEKVNKRLDDLEIIKNLFMQNTSQNKLLHNTLEANLTDIDQCNQERQTNEASCLNDQAELIQSHKPNYEGTKKSSKDQVKKPKGPSK